MLFSVMGPRTYGLLRSLVAPDKPGEMDYGRVVEVLQNHFAPRPLVIAERFRFHKRNQGEEETVAQYVAVLKRLSEHCEFGAYLEDALRDRFVCGLKTETVQKRLLTEKDLTFQKAVDYAVSAETATRDVQQLSSSLKVHAISANKGDQCRRCGKMNHTDEDCWYKDRDCYQCGRKGHTKHMCKSKARSSQARSSQDREWRQKGNTMKRSVKDRKKRIHLVDARNVSESDETKSDTDSELGLYALSEKGKYSRISVLPRVNGNGIGYWGCCVFNFLGTV